MLITNYLKINPENYVSDEFKIFKLVLGHMNYERWLIKIFKSIKTKGFSILELN